LNIIKGEHTVHIKWKLSCCIEADITHSDVLMTAIKI